VWISRTARPHLLRLKAYGTYHAGATFSPSRLGWGLFVLSASILVSSALFGSYVESTGVMEARTYYIRKHTDRYVTNQQKDGILKHICPSANDVQPISVYSVDDPEARQFAGRLIAEMHKCIAICNPVYPDHPELPVPGYASNPHEHGIHIAVMDQSHSDPKSSVLFDKMKDAGFDVEYSQWEGYPPPILPSVFVSYP
jgi:hypothetical protein